MRVTIPNIICQVPRVDVAVPMHLKGQRARLNSLTEENENLNFVVMLKKGNKPQFKGKQSLIKFKVVNLSNTSISRFSDKGLGYKNEVKLSMGIQQVNHL